MKIADDKVLEILREFKAGGIGEKALAQKHGVKPSALYQWTSGVNRPHLLRQVEAEIRNSKGKRQ